MKSLADILKENKDNDGVIRLTDEAIHSAVMDFMHDPKIAATVKPTLVIIESPYAGDVDTNVDYARACVRDSLLRGEAPIASHLLYTQSGILDDDILSERQQGIDAGLAWRRVAHASIVYTDRGITRGMEYGIKAAIDAGLPVIYRTLNK